jgi:mRNA-degrading endonuclease toxin of MazEF toxin-antitoxin module
VQLPVAGVVLSDHLKNQDWQVRRAEFIAALDDKTLNAVLERARTLLSKEEA